MLRLSHRWKLLVSSLALAVALVCALRIGGAWALSHVFVGAITGQCDKGEYRITRTNCVWRCAAALEQGAIWTPMYGCYVFVPAEPKEESR